MKKVKFGVRFKFTPYTWREVDNFGEVVRCDKPFAGDLNERYTKFCNDFKNVKPSTLVDFDVLETFYGDLLNRADIDYLEGHYDSDDEDDIFIRNGGKYFHAKAVKLAEVHKSLIQLHRS
jgi:hypothetical protein|tara:strand:- start:83 stop:442 length:360 start_codon:yes stop_codon:yes gene_type:complete